MLIHIHLSIDNVLFTSRLQLELSDVAEHPFCHQAQLNLNNDGFVVSARYRLRKMKTSTQLAKERSATSLASSQGRDRHRISESRTLQSETQVSQFKESGPLPNLTLKLRFWNSAMSEVDRHPAVQQPLPYATLSPPVTTPHGRTVHKPQNADDANGNKYNQLMEIDGGQGHPVSATLPVQSSTFEDGSFKPPQDVCVVLDSLQCSDKIQIDLPSLSHATNSHYSQPYSAQLLTHLYLTCYQRKLWNLCDMIADTWIRAFHARRKKAQTAPGHQLWRRNKALEERKRKAYEVWRTEGRFVPSEFDQEPRYYGLEVSDPHLAPEVTSIHMELINMLYEHTKSDCGARVLWADALALAGDHTQKSIDAAQKQGLHVHQGLLFNILQTTLRIARRNLTLKIEESTEGAWCKRYHEHTKHGLPCYREVAAKGKDRGSDDQIQIGEEEYHAFMQQASKEKALWFESRKCVTKHVSFGNNAGTDTDSMVG